jgi:hypothetical protein
MYCLGDMLGKRFYLGNRIRLVKEASRIEDLILIEQNFSLLFFKKE